MKENVIQSIEAFLLAENIAERLLISQQLINEFEMLDFNIGNPPFERRLKSVIICDLKDFIKNSEDIASISNDLKMVLDILSEPP